jgi:hypothetical protein
MVTASFILATFAVWLEFLHQPGHVFAVAFFSITNALFSAANHSRIDLRFLGYATRNHDTHHARGALGGNYCQFLSLIDKVMGTFIPYSVPASAVFGSESSQESVVLGPRYGNYYSNGVRACFAVVLFSIIIGLGVNLFDVALILVLVIFLRWYLWQSRLVEFPYKGTSTPKGLIYSFSCNYVTKVLFYNVTRRCRLCWLVQPSSRWSPQCDSASQ